MQCPNCQFFNMPGSERCGRCGSLLKLGGAGISVMPPRATPWQKKFRRLMPMKRVYNRASDAVVATGAARHAAGASRLLFYLWIAIPGWPHFARGQKVRGHLILWSFLLFLFLGLALLGSTWGSIFIGLAFSVHSSGMTDLINQRLPQSGVREQMARGLVVSAVLFGVVYWPVGFVISEVAVPYTVGMPLRPFQNGDTVLVSPRRPPRVGDIVLYDIPAYFSSIPNFQREGHTYHMLEGRNIDRILAGPGSSYECRNGLLLVDGIQSKVSPLNAMKYPPHPPRTLAPDHFLILPSDQSGMLDNTAWEIGSENIIGRVMIRTQPWSRFSIIR